MDNEMSIDKIVEKSKQWTLEGDCTLLQWMNQISNNLEERVTKTSSALNDMSTKLDRTSIALSNATNNLAALQYSKFVENRVHDDDETLAIPANVPSEDVTDNKNSGQDIYSFLKKNLEMMNSCHEAYSISYEDSDDDDDDEPVTNVVYRSKNPYEARPLPHIYGSTLWKEKWHIGLCDSDNDFSGDENSEQFSESSSTADESYESTAPTMSEWDSTAWGLNTQHNVERKDMHTPSNDGESSYQGEDYSQSKVSTPRTQRSIPISQQPPIQDQRYYHHVPRRQENVFDDIFNDSKPQEVAPAAAPQVVPSPQAVHSPQVMPVPQKKIIPESYIPNEPPPDEQSIESDSNRRVGAKKTLNLFDDDEFSSFMDQIVQKATNKNIKSNETPQKNPDTPKSTVVAPNLFNDFNDHTPPDDDDDDFQRQPKKAEPNVHTQKQPIKTVPQNLFNDSDDLFDRPSEKRQEPPKKILPPNLFSDSDDLFLPSISQPPIVKRKSSSPKLEDDIFKTSPKSEAIIGKTKIKNLFDDDDDDDDFDNIFASKPSTSKTFAQATKNLFADDLSVEHENEGVTLEKDEPIKEVSTTSKGLFDVDENNRVLKEKTDPKTSLLKETSNVGKSIFDDEDVKTANIEKQTSPDTPVLKEDASKIGSLLKKGLFDDFDDLEDENDLFAYKPAKRDSFENLFEREKPDKKLSTIQNKTLFGDDDDFEEEIPKVIESRKEEPSSDSRIKESPEDIFSSNTSKNKTQINDIFADDGSADNFDDFVSSKSEKVIEESAKPSDLKLPITVEKVTEPTMKTVINPRKPQKELSTIEHQTLFGDEEQDPNVMQSKKEEQSEDNEKNKQNSDVMTKESPEATFAPSLNIKKTQIDDIFADDVAADNFDDFVSSKVNEKSEAIPESSTKTADNFDDFVISKVNEKSEAIPESSTKPVNATKPNELTTKPVVTPRLPVISQKPLMDKTSKPQVMPKKIVKTVLPEKAQEVENLNSKVSQHEIEKISSSQSESISAPQISETSQITEASKSSEVFKSSEVKVKDMPSLIEEENTQTKILVKSGLEDIKPIPKPKPKVIIEDVKISSPSKDITDEKSPIEQSEKKPSTIPSYTSLFHDDIPPEDENPNSASNEESPLHQVDDDIEVKPISSSTSDPYSSLNLFADVPPDDYFSVSTPPAAVATTPSAVQPETKRIHSIFYDDFHETIEAGREMRAPSSYMINDEPPPDVSDSKPVISEIKKEKPQVPEIQKEKPQTSEIQKEKPQVSKLKKMNFQINVGALLPSAKIPSFKKPDTIEKNEISTKQDLTPSVKSPINNDIVPSQLPSERERELPENILPNLNKDRAKVQVKRRPSTRNGRQERYRKSMIEDTISIANHEESETDNEIKQSMSSSVFEGFAARTQDIRVSSQAVPKEKKNEIKEQKSASSSLFEDFGTFAKKEKPNENFKEILNQMPDQATLFEESDNIFNRKVTSSSSSKATISKIPTLFKDSDSEPENIFETMKSNKKKSEIKSAPPVINKNLDSLFDSDGEIDENPFGTPKNFFPTKESNKPTDEISKKPDLLFESSSSVHQKKESISQPVQPAFKPSAEKQAKTTPKSSTLFGDSDDGSDDLFKNARTSKKAVVQKKPEQKQKTKPITKQAKPSASLFSSDEDSGSGDDIFGKAKTKSASKKTEPLKDKASSNLFADLSGDDSDGLFGTSTKKPIKVNKSKTNPMPTNRAQSTKQPALAQPAKAINSNPLSDLLGP